MQNNKSLVNLENVVNLNFLHLAKIGLFEMI